MARQYALESIRRNLDKMPGLLWAKFVKFISPFYDTPNRAVQAAFAVGWLIVGPLTLLGVYVTWKQERWAAVALFLPILTTLTTCLLFHAEARYRDSASPAFVALAAIGVSSFLLQNRAPHIQQKEE
ncbi:hypothetical protein GF339_11105 [candidate division KSB3 bacterium]|uniref:Uncharacterized protein n=1 Tax=candidate division KSB3 bacterium TaxID=2044937 RepID=A0A9D5Q5S2_9BACT|nr:hypothetical protein [candidate division KSB3 bacterium]MBD3325124.1 hypothetical protein [candidate division KSB3 bacterium]